MRSPVVDLHTRKAWARRHHVRFPFLQRWAIVRYRSRATWRETWIDLLYLVTG